MMNIKAPDNVRGFLLRVYLLSQAAAAHYLSAIIILHGTQISYGIEFNRHPV